MTDISMINLGARVNALAPTLLANGSTITIVESCIR
jgi:hypothetical protein